MGLLANKDNEMNAGKALEDMMDKFGVNLDGFEENDNDDNDEINKRRKDKHEKEKLDY